MKKPTLILILLLFAACAVGGYLVASKLNIGSNDAITSNQTLPTALASQQQNFLLVRVDELTSPSPQLVEVWVVFTAYTDPPQIMFMPLYPSYDSEKNKTIMSAFGIDSDGILSKRLSETISKRYNISLNGDILVDSQGMQALSGWFGFQGIEVNSSPARTEEEVHAILLNSQFFLQNVCSQIKAGQATTQFNSIKWSKLIPSHFQTNLSFEHLMASWDRIIHGHVPQSCEVLSNE